MTIDAKAIDAYVGRKVRETRLLRGMIQADLAARIGLSFQQLQKYETGRNRISASKLYEIARILDVGPCTFFEGLEGADAGADDLIDERTTRAAQALASIQDERVKERLRSMIHEIAASEGKAKGKAAA